ncbi:sporulation protein [Nocardia inohanensis]|uniref:sporulation protein n=1 Tax=Nocardia inohanensis TaxID=209246 RepID=UPI00082AEE4D|nr:sporulation protein [Nocardia inohanensis]
MFRKLLAAVGVGGAEVDTELHTPGVQPGGTVHGVIRLRGGDVPQDISRVALEFVTRVEFEHTEDEYQRDRGFYFTELHGPFQLPAQARYDIPFALYTPLEAPITFYNGRQLPGMHVAIRTVVEIAGAVDAGDSDPLGIGALPAQHVILAAMEELGFPLHAADCEWGKLRGIEHELPFYQEIEFGRSRIYPQFDSVEITFVAHAQGVEVLLEIDKKRGSDAYQVLTVGHGDVDQVDWVDVLHRTLLGLLPH